MRKRDIIKLFKDNPVQSRALNDNQSDMVSKFTLHSGDKCPVDPGSFVVYRTVLFDPDGEEIFSHIHAPAKAGLMNWGFPAFGRVYDYMVVVAKDMEFFKREIEGVTSRRKKALGMV